MNNFCEVALKHEKSSYCHKNPRLHLLIFLQFRNILRRHVFSRFIVRIIATKSRISKNKDLKQLSQKEQISGAESAASIEPEHKTRQPATTCILSFL